jgi:MazG family protein
VNRPAPAALPGTARLLDVVARLRGEGGCPWDREQTLESLRPYLVEECYEVLDALESGDPDAHCEELGDVLLQVVLHARIRQEDGQFDFDAVAGRLADKLIRRHPHVFAEAEAADAAQVVTNWERIKAAEKGDAAGEPRSLLAGVPRHLPALQKAQRVQARASRVGFDWTDRRDVTAKVHEELAEIEEAAAGGSDEQVTEEVGDLLFAVVNLARHLGVDAELALRGTVAKFMRRFHSIERRLQAEGRTVHESSLAELDLHWEAVKREERGDAAPRP